MVEFTVFKMLKLKIQIINSEVFSKQLCVMQCLFVLNSKYYMFLSFLKIYIIKS